MQEATEMATELMDKKISTFAERQAENKRKLDNNHQTQQQLPKRQNMVQAYASGLVKEKEMLETLPLLQNKCSSPQWPMHVNAQTARGLDPLLTKLEFPQELSKVHNTFHVSNLKKCYADEPLAVLLDGLHLDDKLHFVEEPLEIVGQLLKLKRV
ncbi:hypothetical protein Tco_0215936 [Tanacetum coccineum]